MFPNAASAIHQHLSTLTDAIVLNFGSGDAEFYQQQQPYIWTEVMTPLMLRRNVVINIDAKAAPGVHIVTDIQYLRFDQLADVALCCNLLEHVERVHTVLLAVWRAVKPRGLVIFESPANYPYHPDPIDNGLRLYEFDDWRNLLTPLFQVESCELLTREGYPGQTATLACARKIP